MTIQTTANNRAPDIPTPLTRWEKFWLLVDAAAALTDQAFDMIMMHEYAANEEWGYFCVGLGTVLAPIFLTKCTCFCCGPIEGCIQDQYGNDGDNFFVQFVPGINMLVAAVYAVVLPRRKFKTKATRMEKVYKQTRAFEAFLEAGPQAIFQVMVALHQVEGIRTHILITSLSLSLFSLTKTLVTFFIFEDYTVYFRTYGGGFGNFERTLRNDFPDRGTKVRMFLLSLFYGLSEVTSVVLSISLLGYFCGWYSIVISFAIQYVLLFIYLRVRGFGYNNMNQSDEDKANWRYLLIPLLTSFVGGRALPFKSYLCARIFILGSYVAAIILINWDSADLNVFSEIMVWVAIVATGLWALIMPAFVNSCYNLKIAFYSWSEDRYVTDRFTKCFYPLEILPDSKYCCSVSTRSLELTEEVADTAANAVSAALEA